MKIATYTPQHLERLTLQPYQAMLQPLLSDPEYRQSLFEAGPAISAVEGDEVLASMGLIPQWDGRAVAWALVSLEARKNLLGITRAIMRSLDLFPYRRVETPVATNFVEGHRWAHLLGFKNEGTMRCYTPQGEDCDLYAKIRLDLL